MADNCLRIYVVLQLAGVNELHRRTAWHLVTFLLMAPAVVFAPLNGAICNSLPKPLVLIGSSAFAWIALFAVYGGDYLKELLAPEHWHLVGWCLVALSSAVNGPVRYAFLPAAARDAGMPLTRVNGLFEMGSAIAIVGGLILGAQPLGRVEGWPVPEVMFLGLYSFSLVVAFPVAFPSDVRRPEQPTQAVRGFFADCLRIWREKETRRCLIGLASLRGLMTGMMGALIAATLADGVFSLEQLLRIGACLLGGVAGGSFLAGLQRHPRRDLGLVPWGATGLTVGLIFAALGQVPGDFLCVLLGIMVGLVNVPLAATYQADLPDDARGNGMAIRNFADYLAVAVMAGVLFGLAQWLGVSSTGQLWIIALLAAVLAGLSWCWLLREVAELILEFLLWPCYRIRAHGPGLASVPLRGPVVVVANHSAWLDPMWIAKLLPRSLIPMLTSVFFDLPKLRWLMEHLAHAVRVQAGTFRREVPEIDDAIDVLDRGQALLIFPEGALRKKAEQFLRNFGQGIWHILKERPNTPVVVCWIEGGWGSYFSYFQGKPTQNKRMDFRRRIDVAIAEPIVLDAETLADHRATRQFLMRQCLRARSYLGLPVPDLGQEKTSDDDTA
jgi:1-acyl-sn-glycerol-3-phosphate acyltransferase